MSVPVFVLEIDYFAFITCSLLKNVLEVLKKQNMMRSLRTCVLEQREPNSWQKRFFDKQKQCCSQIQVLIYQAIFNQRFLHQVEPSTLH